MSAVLRPLTHRRQWRAAGGTLIISALIATGLTTLVPPASGRTAALANSSTGATVHTAPSFHTVAAGLQVDAVMGVVNGVKQRGSVRPLVDAQAETLTVALDKPVIEDYWYWSDGVTVTITGARPSSKLIIRDFAPDGALATTFDPVLADSTGSATVKLQGEMVGVDYPAVGVHRLTVNSSVGEVGSALLTVVPLEGRTVKVTTSPATLTQKQWFTTQIKITATGFRPNAALYMNLFDPAGSGMAVGRALRADATGTFRYTLQAGTAFALAGVWVVSLISYDGATTSMGTTGWGDFTITPSPTGVVGSLTTSPRTVTADRFGTSGVRYTVSGVRPWAVASLTLRTPLGTDYFLAYARANGEGRLSDVITSFGDVSTGTYQITARVIDTGDRVQGTFLVTKNDGTIDPAPTMALGRASLTRLQTMDPGLGIVAEASAFTPGSVVYIEIRDNLNALLPLASSSITVAPADARGRITFAVNPKRVPAVGTYTVKVFTYLYPQVITRATLTITA